MIELKSKADCCGCSACAEICAHHAILLSYDEEGFEYPEIDSAKCVNCGLCEKVCPIINVRPEQVRPQKAYLLQIKDEIIRKESTSGGSFTAIASWVIRQKGVVFGAVFDASLTFISHQYVDNERDLSLFRNSKYVQSKIGEAYKMVRSYLKQDRWVCFSGTPCQIEGLVSFLTKPYPKLLLIDVVCYGIPSPGIFKDYLAWQKEKRGGEFTRFLFREKLLSYNYTSISIYNKDSSRDYHCGVERDKFMRSFFSNCNIRPSCYSCKFKKRYRVSDFTIWDCYEVEKFTKNMDDNGTNRILAHTEKAVHIINEIRDDVRLEEYGDIDYFIKDEKPMTRSVRMSKDREDFFADYQSMPFSLFIDKWLKDTLMVRLNSFLRMTAYKLGIYNKAKKVVKTILHKK